MSLKLENQALIDQVGMPQWGIITDFCEDTKKQKSAPYSSFKDTHVWLKSFIRGVSDWNFNFLQPAMGLIKLMKPIFYPISEINRSALRFVLRLYYYLIMSIIIHAIQGSHTDTGVVAKIFK